MAFPQRGDLLSGRYEIRELLGEGGMGRVYLAFDRELETEVAVKVLKGGPDTDPTRLRRFEREIQTLQKIAHPDILHYLDHGRHGEVVYLTVELLKGRSLAEAGPEFHGQAERVLALGVRLARAFEAAHAKGIIHRDIKPANIHITDGGEPRVLDYGIARWEVVDENTSKTQTAVERLTQTDAVMGTIPYMSPEQIHAEKVDRRGDIYSLAVVLYELATGSRPYEAPSVQDQIRRMEAGPPPTLKELRPDLDTPPGNAMDAVLRRALDPLPQQRFQSMGELAEALGKALDLGGSIPQDATSAILLPPAVLLAQRDLCTPFGREREMAALEQALKRAQAGEGIAVAVVAPEGMGKSLLVSEVVRLAHRQGWLCLVAAREPVVAWLDRAHEIFPSDRAVSRALELRDGDAVRDALSSLASRMPLLLLLEDAHEAAPPALSLVGSVLAACSDLRLLVLITSRSDTALPSASEAELGSLLSRPGVETLSLAPLGAESLRLLAEEAYPGLILPESLLPRFVERSGGNPAFARSILSLLVEEGAITRQGSDWTAGRIRDLPFPPEARSTLKRRLSDLPAGDVSLLEAAAVLGESFEPSALAEVLGRDAGEITSHLGALAGRGRLLVREPDVFRFDQPLNRELLHDRIDPGRKAALHLQAAKVISAHARGDPSPEQTGALANHYLEAGRPGEALPYVITTALLFHSARVPDQAIPWLDRARLLLEQQIETVDEEERGLLRSQLAEIHLAFGEALDTRARHAEALEHLEQARTLAITVRRTDVQMRSLIGMSRAYIARGDVLQAQRRAKDAAKLARSTNEAERALAISTEAHALSLAGDLEAAEEKWREAIGSLQEMGLEDDAAEVQFRLANHHFRLGRLDQAEAGYAAAAARVSPDENPKFYAGILNARAAGILARGRPAEALPQFEEAARIRRAVGYRSGEATSLHNIAYCQHLLGNWHEAGRIYGEVIAIRRELGEVAHRSRAQRNYAEVLLDLGRIEEALFQAADAASTQRQVEDLGYVPACLALLGEIEVQLGRTERARDAFGEIVRDFPDHRQEALEAALGLATADWLSRQTESAARRVAEVLEQMAGRKEPAIGPHPCYRILLCLREGGTPAERLREIASPLLDNPTDDLRETRMWCARVRALLAEREGRPAEARGFLREALEISTSLGSVERTWRIHRDMAQLEPEGSPARAASFEAAVEIVESQAQAFQQDELRRAYRSHRERADLLRER